MGNGDGMNHIADVLPGSDTRCPPRAFLRSDAPSFSLNGAWQFTVHTADPGDAGLPPFASTGFDCADWSTVVVPGHWVLQGHGRPIYTNIQYPFPIDPAVCSGREPHR